MQKLEKIVINYLNSKTDYALMITGKWGVGKTYYYKNTLKRSIEETPTLDNGSKNFKPVLVSLFGLKSIEEVQTEILLSLYPILKSKAIKLGAGISQTLIKGALKLTPWEGFSSLISDSAIKAGDLISFDNLVICFDDLERSSDSLSFKEFIGFVNNLVENEHAKILIIANEKEIEEKEYSVLKEKVIGNAIEFLPNLNSTIESIIEEKFVGFSEYQKFLLNNKELVLEVFVKNSSNLRTLSFAFAYYQNIYSGVCNQIMDYKVLAEKKDEILLMLLRFSLAISIEYKEGGISYKQKENLDDAKFDFSHIPLDTLHLKNPSEKEKAKEKPYKETFIEKYYQDEKFTFFNSIFDFVTGGAFFEFDRLINELKSIFHIQGDEIPIHYELFNQLSSEQVLSLTDIEYNRLTKELLGFAEKGLYNLSYYPTIFQFIIRFDNPLRFKPENLEKKLIIGMKRGIINYKYENPRSLTLPLSDAQPEHKERLQRLVDAALEINDKVKQKFDYEEVKRLEGICHQNFSSFSEEVLDLNSNYYSMPILKDFNVHKFYRLFLNSSGDVKWQVILFFRSRYIDYSYNKLIQEADFLIELKIKLERKINNLPKSGVTKYLYTRLVDTIQPVIENLTKNS